MSSTSIQVYSDGACHGNPGPGGWGWATAPSGAYQGSGAVAKTTNQQMELRAAIEALKGVRDLPGAVTVVTDSMYVINGFEKRWVDGWRRNGWMTSQKKPVANKELWEQLYDLVHARTPRVTFRWVKGHSGVPMNELVDSLATAACTLGKASR